MSIKAGVSVNVHLHGAFLQALDGGISGMDSIIIRPPSSSFTRTMTTVVNAPDWWPVINFNRNFSYFIGSWGAR
jgi:hypothetical protein